MAYKPILNFSSGEVSPKLRQRTNLARYESSLAVLRNMLVSGTGGISSMAGTSLDILPKFPDRKVLMIYLQNESRIVEWGHEYVRIHNTVDGTVTEDAHDWLESDIPFIHYSNNGEYLFLSRFGKVFKRMFLGTIDPFDHERNARFLQIKYSQPLSDGIVVNTVSSNGTGFLVEYVFTLVRGDKRETPQSEVIGGATIKQPRQAGERNEFNINDTALPPNPNSGLYLRDNATTVRAYVRPKDGNKFGYVGESSSFTVDGTGKRIFKFIDLGATPDYSRNPPKEDEDFVLDTYERLPIPDIPGQYYSKFSPKPRTLLVYQKKLIISGTKDEEAIFTSRSKLFDSWNSDSPVNDVSALAFKAGSNDTAKILRYHDGNSLMAFTSTGLYANLPGILGPNNIAMIRRSNIIIDESVQPLDIPGAILVVEKNSGKVIALNYSEDAQRYKSVDISLFSSHLFEKKKVVSWTFQDSTTPLIWMVMSDGTLNILTYEPSQELNGWSWADTRHGKYESVGVHVDSEGVQRVYFIVNRNGQRVHEVLANRYNDDSRYDIATHSTVFKELNMKTVDTVTHIAGDEYFLEYNANGDFQDVDGEGAEGTIFRTFYKDFNIDYEVLEYISPEKVRVSVDIYDEYPDDLLSNVPLWQTFDEVDGLDHLEGLEVSIRLDGFRYASPLNPDYPKVKVINGKVELSKKGSIVSVGLPYVQDFQTLNVDTVEQKPSFLASVNNALMYVSTYLSYLPLFGNDLPPEDSIDGLEDVSRRSAYADDEQDPNTLERPKSEDNLQTCIDGSWSSHGKVSGRMVDPDFVEIIAVRADLDIHYKG